jgi:hypothetical protein
MLLITIHVQQHDIFVDGFVVVHVHHKVAALSTSMSPVSRLFAAPNYSSKPIFDKTTQKWKPSPKDDGKYPYDAVGALLRHGPVPFFQRIFNPQGYEQSVLQYMASTGCSRAEATGNMDAKLNVRRHNEWGFEVFM